MTKKLSLITTLIILLTASLAFAVPPSPPSSTTGATINDSAGNGDNTVVYSADKVFDLLALKQAALSLIAGTYTNGYLCKYTAAGTLLDCNVDPAGYQSSDTELTAIADLANGAGALTNDGSGNFSYVAAGAFAVTSITDQTDDTTPTTTATLPLAQGGSLIESTVQQIVNSGLAAPAAIGSGTPAAGTFTTLGAGAGGFAIDADGDVTAKSVTISKVSGVAGDMAVYEANSTDTHGAGFRGPASITGDGAYRIRFPNARSAAAGQVLSVTNAAESGTGTAADPYVQTATWKVIPSTQFVSFVIPAPAATDDINIMKAPYGMTITAISCIVQGTTSVTGQLQECDSAGANCADLDSDIACDADGAADDGTLTDSAIASGGWLRWKTTSISDTPTFLTVTVKYNVVAD